MIFDSHLIDTAINIAATEGVKWTPVENIEAAKAFAASENFMSYVASALITLHIDPKASIATTFQCGFEAGMEYQRLLEEDRKSVASV